VLFGLLAEPASADNKDGVISITGMLRSRYKWYWATGCFLRADDQMAGCRSAFSSGGFICRNEYSSATS
jgi:hypothetical protein